MKLLLDFLRLVRFPNLVVIALTQYAIRYGIIFPFLLQAELNFYLPESTFALLVLATVMIAAAGYIINDYFDIKLDYLNKPKQLVLGRSIKRRHAMALHIFINAIGLFIAGYVAYSIGHPMLILFQFVSAALLWYYSVSFKKQVVIGNLIIASLTALVPFTAGYYEVAVMFDNLPDLTGAPEDLNMIENLASLLFSIKFLLYWIIGYSIFAFLLTFIREIVKDIEDIEGDEAFDCKTLPIVFGIPAAKKAAIAFAVITLLGLLFLEAIQFMGKDWISFAYFFILLTLPIIWVIYRIVKAEKKKHYFIISQAIKIIMLFGILYTSIIYLF
jgi:4-hydroxybenzoate polyprenyltransferase